MPNRCSSFVWSPWFTDEYIIKELPIETGLESDFNVEISGEGITDGIIIIDDPSTSMVGDKIQINEGWVFWNGI